MEFTHGSSMCFMILLNWGHECDVLGSCSSQCSSQTLGEALLPAGTCSVLPHNCFSHRHNAVSCTPYLRGGSLSLDIGGFAEVFPGWRKKHPSHCRGFWALVSIRSQTGVLFCYFSMFLNWDLADLGMMLNTQFDSVIFLNQLNF